MYLYKNYYYFLNFIIRIFHEVKKKKNIDIQILSRIK